MAITRAIGANPELITWAREESGYDVAQVAKRLNVKEESIVSWEGGTRIPTVRQLLELARFLHRPHSVFFLPSPPRIPPLAAEYRHLPKVIPGDESPELRLALRQMLTRREIALNLMEELGEPIGQFSLQAHLSEAPVVVGRRVRDAVGIDVQSQLAWRDSWSAWREWRNAIERLNVFVFQFAKVSPEEVRGMTLPRTPMPILAVNSKELPEVRCYTLVHELVHLMLAAANDEAPALRESRSAVEWDAMERFAEIAASYALVPEETLGAAIHSAHRSGEPWDLDTVRNIARRFRVTPLAVATRLRESCFMTWDEYNGWKTQWDRYIKTLKPRIKGFATPVDKTIGRAGYPFARLVLEALTTDRITAVDASRYLHLKYQHFEDLRKRIRYEHAAGETEA